MAQVNYSLPSWSPDGRKIVFVSERDGNFEVYVMNADGSGQRNLTRHPGHDSAPAWSPDGRKIAFTTKRDGNFEVYVMNADGSGQQNLTRNPAPDRSPSGRPGRRSRTLVQPARLELALLDPQVARELGIVAAHLLELHRTEASPVD